VASLSLHCNALHCTEPFVSMKEQPSSRSHGHFCCEHRSPLFDSVTQPHSLIWRHKPGISWDPKGEWCGNLAGQATGPPRPTQRSENGWLRNAAICLPKLTMRVTILSNVNTVSNWKCKLECSLNLLLLLLLLIFPLALQPNSGLGSLHETFGFTLVTRSRTVGSTPWTGDQLVARPLPVHKYRETHAQHKH
jgi:hypothetical protein